MSWAASSPRGWPRSWAGRSSSRTSAAPAAWSARPASRGRRPTATNSCLGSVGTHAQNQTLYKNPLYNSATDFAPVALVAEQPIVLAARKDFPRRQPAGVHRLHQGEPGEDAVRLAGSGLFEPPRLRAVHLGDRREGHAHPLSHRRRRRIDRRPDRLPVPDRGGRRSPLARGQAGKDDRDTDPQRWSRACRTCHPRTSRGSRISRPTSGTLCSCRKGTPPADRAEGSTPPPVAGHGHARSAGEAGDVGATVPAPERRSPEYLQKFVENEIAKWAGPIKAAGVTMD